MEWRAIGMIVLLVACAFVHAADAPFEFKGPALGAELDPIKATKRFDCSDSDNRAFADQNCFPAAGQIETIAGVRSRKSSTL